MVTVNTFELPVCSNPTIDRHLLEQRRFLQDESSIRQLMDDSNRSTSFDRSPMLCVYISVPDDTHESVCIIDQDEDILFQIDLDRESHFPE
jgi:hypothetical protein